VKALVVLTAADQTATTARFLLRAAMDVVVSLSAAADAMAPPAPRPLLLAALLAAATLTNTVAFGRKPTSPLTTLSASAACTGTRTYLRSKGFSRPGDAGDVSAFLVNFLANRCIKATKVLKDADLDPTDVHSGFALRALLEKAEDYMPDTIHTDTDGDGTDCRSDSQPSSASADD
jgi:hypothetical protein